MTPHKCPVCDGSGKRKRKECPACKGQCVLWSMDKPIYVPTPVFQSPYVYPSPWSYTTDVSDISSSVTTTDVSDICTSSGLSVS